MCTINNCVVIGRANADLSHEQELKGMVAKIFNNAQLFGRD